MKEFQIFIDASATMKLTVIAENSEEALEKAEEFTQSEDFWEQFRENSDFVEPIVSDSVWNITDSTWED